jgi:hypothetical protein
VATLEQSIIELATVRPMLYSLKPHALRCDERESDFGDLRPVRGAANALAGFRSPAPPD